MTNNKLYELLALPIEVTEKLNKYEATRTKDIPENIYNKLFIRTEWEHGINELQQILNDDVDGIKILWEQLNIVCKYTFEEYQKKVIDTKIFTDTMRFCTKTVLK